MEAASHTGEHRIVADGLVSSDLSPRDNTVFAVLVAISFCHLLSRSSDSMQIAGRRRSPFPAAHSSRSPG
jgi:hypothetical protein